MDFCPYNPHELGHLKINSSNGHSWELSNFDVPFEWSFKPHKSAAFLPPMNSAEHYTDSQKDCKSFLLISGHGSRWREFWIQKELNSGAKTPILLSSSAFSPALRKPRGQDPAPPQSAATPIWIFLRLPCSSPLKSWTHLLPKQIKIMRTAP